MWSRSHPPTPGQQPLFVCFWDPEGADRALHRKLERLYDDQLAAESCDHGSVTVTDNVAASGLQVLVNISGDVPKNIDTGNPCTRNEILSAPSEGGKSGDSSPDSQKTSDKSSLSGPSWRMRRDFAEFRVATSEINNTKRESSKDSKEAGQCPSIVTNTHINELNVEEAPRPLMNPSIKPSLSDTRYSAKNDQEPVKCKEQTAMLHRRRLGQVFVQTSQQGSESNTLTSFTGSEAERNDYFDDVGLPSLPSRVRATSHARSKRPTIRQRSTESACKTNSVNFRTSIFDADIPIGSRPEYARGASSGLIQKLRREARSEETEPFIGRSNLALRTSDLLSVNDTPSSRIPRSKRTWKPQFLRAPASAPTIKLRKTGRASITDIPRDSTGRDGIGRDRGAWRKTIRSSEDSNSSVHNSDDINLGSPPSTKEGALRKYWTLGLRNPLLFPVYMGTSKRSRLIGKSSPSLSPDDREFHYSSESQSTLGLAATDSEQMSATEVKINDNNNNCFRIRSSQLTNEEDGSDEEKRKYYVDIPDHLPSSPLCPLNAKYRGDKSIECPQHRGRRKGSTVPKLK